MSETTIDSITLSQPQLDFPVPLICPNCQAPALIREEDRVECSACNHAYGVENGFLDLIIGDRFEDESDDTCLCYEEVSNNHTTRHYWIPLFKRLWPKAKRKIRLLAVGCGTGVEVDMLHAAGFEVVGIEIGNRTRIWPQRQAKDWLLLANGMHLPFATDTFDGVFCGCVFPHVGVVGDSFQVTEQCQQDRLAMAQEMVRVIKPGGHLLASSPNRLFSADIFHGRKPGSYVPRPNWPGSRFLLSLKDYRELLCKAGCTIVEAQPTTDYWGFVRSKHSWKGLLLGLPVRFLFWITSLQALPFLRTSPLAPWLVVSARK